VAPAKTVASARNAMYDHRDPRLFENDDATMDSTTLISGIRFPRMGFSWWLRQPDEPSAGGQALRAPWE
jgi:hypothetical protein